MAIVNTFEKCLEGPYLSRDDSAAEAVGELLRRASDRLEAAAGLRASPKGDPADLCLLAYEAMFCCLRALVYRLGYREAGLRCLLLACEALYVRPGRLDARHLLDFERAQALKLPPDEALDAAAALVKRTLELLQPSGPAGLDRPGRI
ncbi:HEPN domain-containing protein [Tautonia sociabilis]|uniref:HEPN domain-containing protein n=1 Tax=Tautonia sociabilis TaxID=2080755 RepID=A0A432MHT3_9BACT|nr:HEPN domain-containing protein [Tautonia sociabilis]RUL86501.1 HEPN domain-containing protein [Tautonia sociabilis]